MVLRRQSWGWVGHALIRNLIRAGATALFLGFRLLGVEMSDNFADRPVVTGVSGAVTGSNTTATIEPGEPRHGGKRGVNSVWLSWVAPANGVVRFSTEGSSFDSLLSVYLLDFEHPEKPVFARLDSKADGDDEGEGQSAVVEFGVIGGQAYEVAVDGFARAKGNYQLSWDMKVTAKVPPLIIQYPTDRSLKVGDTLELTVNLSNGEGADVRWYFNDRPIPDAEKSTLVLKNFQPANVGRYRVRVEHEEAKFFSAPVEIQVNEEGEISVLARDKALEAGNTGVGVAGPAAIARPRRVGLQDGLSHGFKGTQIFNTAYAVKDPGEPVHCGIVGGASYWFAYRAPASGILSVDTVGSDFDTLLAVYGYTAPLTSYGELAPVGCDNDSGPDRRSSVVNVPVEEGRDYMVVVDGVLGARGIAFLNYRLEASPVGFAPEIVVHPAPAVVESTAAFCVKVEAKGTAPFRFQWYKDGTAVAGATNAIIRWSAVHPHDSGRYSVLVSNGAGSVRSLEANLTVVTAATMEVDRASGRLRLRAQVGPGISYAVERLEDIAEELWKPVLEGVGGPEGVVVMPSTDGRTSAFFRVRVW